MKKIIALLFSIMAVWSFGQKFSGQALLRDNSYLYLNQIFVTNLKTNKTILTDYNGNFSIDAQKGDVIRFTSIVTERLDVELTGQRLETPNNIIELKIAYREIPELVMNSFRPTGNLRRDVASLKGIEKKVELEKMIGLPQPKGDGTSPQLPVAALAGGGLTFSLNSIYDILSGERKKQERYQNFEQMMTYISTLRSYFGDDYFIKLKIPKNLIDNFLQFVYSSDNLKYLASSNNFEAVKPSIEKYLPIYLRRLQNSNLGQIAG